MCTTARGVWPVLCGCKVTQAVPIKHAASLCNGSYSSTTRELCRTTSESDISPNEFARRWVSQEVHLACITEGLFVKCRRWRLRKVYIQERRR